LESTNNERKHLPEDILVVQDMLIKLHDWLLENRKYQLVGTISASEDVCQYPSGTLNDPPFFTILSISLRQEIGTTSRPSYHKHNPSHPWVHHIMVNPSDVADALRNETNEILTAYLLNLLGFIP